MELHIIGLLLIGIRICHSVQSPYDKVCSSGWSEVRDDNSGGTVCYKLYQDLKTWKEAQKTCEKHYGHLLILDEGFYQRIRVQNISLLQTTVRTILLDSGIDSVWTSLHISGGKLWWQQTIPQPVPQGSSSLWTWAAGQPLLHTGKCAQTYGKIWRRPTSMNVGKITLSLRPCEETKPFICVQSGFIVRTSQVQQCPRGWYGTPYSNKCWKYFQDKPSDYSGALTHCRKQGGTLASPSTELQYRLLYDTVEKMHQMDSNNLTCVSCTNKNSEEECFQQGLRQTCTLDQICETQVKLQQGKLTFSKGCGNLAKCHADLETTKQLCHSGDVVLQTGFTEVTCYDCCNTTDCNQRLMDGSGPLAVTLNNFHNRMQPSRRKRADSKIGGGVNSQIQGLAFWIGLTKNVSYYSWESGAEFNIDSGHFLPTYEGPPTAGCVRVVDSFWQVVDCGSVMPFVCERQAVYGVATITKQPSDTALISHSIDWVHSKLSHHQLTCEVQGYHPQYPVLWIKDGIFINNGFPPAGFQLNITKDLVYKVNPQAEHSVPSLQGYYQCQVWRADGTARVTSNRALLTFKDILTYRGSLKLPKNNQSMTIQRLTLEWGSHLFIQQYNMIVGMLTTVQVTSYVFSPEVEIHDIRTDNETTVHFSLYYTLSRIPASSWKEIMEKLNVSITWDHKHRYKKFFAEFDRKFLMNLKQDIEHNKITNSYSDWNHINGNLNVTFTDITVRSTVACPEEYVTIEDGKFRFLTTEKNEIANSDEICFSDGKPLATRHCIGDFTQGVSWMKPNVYKDCIQPEYSPVTKYLKALSQRQINENNMNGVSQELVKWTEDEDILNFVDLVYSSKVIRNLAESHKPSGVIGDSLVQSVDNLISASKDKIAKAQLIDKASTRIVEGLDTYSRKSEVIGSNYTFYVQPKLALQIWESQDLTQVAIGIGTKKEESLIKNDNVTYVNFYNGDKRSIEEMDFSDTETAVIFSQDVFGMANDFFYVQDEMMDIFGVNMNPNEVRISFTIHQSSDLFQTPSQLHRHKLQYVANSQVIAGEVNGIPINNLSSPVRAVFTPIRNVSLSEQWCVYWDFRAAGGLGNWSTEGCWMEGYRDGKIICLCNHLTNFAVLTQVEYSDISQDHKLALGIISVIGIILSIVGLTLTIFTYVLFRNLRKGMSQKALVNLAVALLCVNIVFLAGIDRTENYDGCLAVALLLHYFLLVAFGWMLVEGVLQYLKFVKVLNTYVEHFMLKTAIPVWGCPAIICGLVAIIDWRLFRGHDSFCWIDLPAFYYAFLLPVGCVIAVNTVLFILVVKGITCDRPKGLTSTQSKSELKWLQVKATVSCFVVLGLTWIFGFFALRTASLVFQYLFCFLNAFQGFWIFLCYCIREPAARTHWWNLLRCKKHLGKRKHSTTASSAFSFSKREPTSPTDINQSWVFPWSRKKTISQSASDSSQKIENEWSSKKPVSQSSSDSSQTSQPLCNNQNTDEKSKQKEDCVNSNKKKTCTFADEVSTDIKTADVKKIPPQNGSPIFLDKPVFMDKYLYENVPSADISNIYVNLTHVANLVKKYEKSEEQEQCNNKVYINAGYDSTET